MVLYILSVCRPTINVSIGNRTFGSFLWSSKHSKWPKSYCSSHFLCLCVYCEIFTGIKFGLITFSVQQLKISSHLSRLYFFPFFARLTLLHSSLFVASILSLSLSFVFLTLPCLHFLSGHFLTIWNESITPAKEANYDRIKLFHQILTELDVKQIWNFDFKLDAFKFHWPQTLVSLHAFQITFLFLFFLQNSHCSTRADLLPLIKSSLSTGQRLLHRLIVWPVLPGFNRR